MMLTPQERVLNLLSDLRIQPVDFDAVYAGKNNLTPLESVELFLMEEQRLRIEKQKTGIFDIVLHIPFFRLILKRNLLLDRLFY